MRAGPMDSHNAVFDEKVASEYVSWTTQNPLVSGLSQRDARNSDFVVYSSDRNVTIRSFTDPIYVQKTRQTILQKMIEIVPGGVVLPASLIQLLFPPPDCHHVSTYALHLPRFRDLPRQPTRTQRPLLLRRLGHDYFDPAHLSFYQNTKYSSPLTPSFGGY
jgi:hypothetical protein